MQSVRFSGVDDQALVAVLVADAEYPYPSAQLLPEAHQTQLREAKHEPSQHSVRPSQLLVPTSSAFPSSCAVRWMCRSGPKVFSKTSFGATPRSPRAP